MISLKLLIVFVLGVIVALGLLYAAEPSNPWEYLDGYSDRAKMDMCFAYDYRPTGIGKLFNELAGAEPAGTVDELEQYLASRCQ